MKTYRKQFTIALSLSAFALTSASLPAAQGDQRKQDRRDNPERASERRAGMNMRAHDTLQVATENSTRHELGDFVGQELRGANGEDIGKVKDFIIDAKTGKIVFAVISSGGFAGLGDTLRLLPFQALERANNNKGFTTVVQQSQWSKMPALNEQDFEEGRINLTADQRREVVVSESYAQADTDIRGRARYPMPPAPFPPSPDATTTPDATASTSPSTTRRRAESSDVAADRDLEQSDFGRRMVRATKLKGKSVRAGNDEVGEIDDVIIDFDRGVAMALVDVESDFAGSDDEYLIPMTKLEFGVGQKNVTTKLTRTDFQDAHSRRNDRSERRMTNAERTDETRVNERQVRSTADRQQERVQRSTNAAVNQDDRLTPTGRTAAGSTVDPAVESAARAIKQMWEQHPQLAKLNLKVAAENGKLVFRGSVPNKELWERAKDTAKDVVRGIDIENRITIQP